VKSEICLSHHADLKARAGGFVLVLPERAIRLGGSGGEILELCGMPRSEDEIVALMCTRYPEDASVGGEVRDFLAQMLRLGALVRVESPKRVT
jgi:hypothetical protein